MITVNLLPEHLPKRQRMSRNQFVGLFVFLVVLLALGCAIAAYRVRIIPGLQQEQLALTQSRNGFAASVQELRLLENEIDSASDFVNTVKGVYRRRVVWAKVLSDIKNIVTLDPSMAEYIDGGRSLWLTGVSARDKTVSMDGFATAETREEARKIPERLLQQIRDHTPTNLQAKNGKGGDIALIPLSQLLVPGTLRLTSAVWTRVPRLHGLSDDDESRFPKEACVFSITMELK